MSNRHDRVKHMTERYLDAHAENAPDDSDRTYDLDDKKDRQDYMLERLNGTEFEDVPAAVDE